MMHRVILNPPKDKKVDHINHDKLDNCKSNLRVCTQFENCQNRKVRGSVTFHKNRIRKNWQARLGINYKRISLGYYNSSHEARIAVNNYIMKGA